MAINPAYLESLKTYEVLASSEHLFLQAVDHFQLPHSKRIDQLKRSVLGVKIPRNTRILEIAATLSDARTAQALSLYLAQQVVDLSRFTTSETDLELIANVKKELDDASTRMQDAERAWAEVESAPVNQTTTRSMRVDVAQANREAARDAFEAVHRRLQEVRLGVGYRGERLTIIDPGLVPGQASSPNIPLNLVAALLIGLVAALFYLTLEFNYRIHGGLSLAAKSTKVS
jgi:capsular polysaccharide biosynthesis protein